MNRICFDTKGTPKRQANGKLSGNRLSLRRSAANGSPRYRQVGIRDDGSCDDAEEVDAIAPNSGYPGFFALACG
jgi:hypothetical protein